MNLYAIMIFLSFLAGFLFIFFSLHHQGIPKNIIGLMLLLNIAFILYFAKLLTVITSGFHQNMITAGLSSLGGAFGLISSMFIFTKIYRFKSDVIYQSYAIALPLMYGISKLGCHFAGCCYGIPYHGFLSVKSIYENQYTQLFPVQLTETIVFLVIFVCSFLLYRMNRKIYYLGFEIILCTVTKFVLDFFRFEHINRILSKNQFICFLFFSLGIFLYIRKYQKKNS